MKNNIGKIIIILILVALIIAVCILFYQNSQKENQINQLKDKIENGTNIGNEITINNENTDNKLNLEVTNKIDQVPYQDEVPGDMGEYYISIGKWKEFEFNTPVGEEGKFTVYAEKAVQASGFSGASAHIYYLRERELYYHNQQDNDVKLASGITDLEKQGENIIAVKGENAKIYIDNQYIEYK